MSTTNFTSNQIRQIAEILKDIGTVTAAASVLP
jgi:hypothetical protein